MPMADDERRLMDELMAYENPYADAVKEAGDDALLALQLHGVETAQDDRRAKLDAAIYAYLLSCGG